MVYRLHRVRGESEFMILGGICYTVIHFCGVILSCMVEFSCSQYFWSYLTSTLYQYFHLRSSMDVRRPPFDATMLMIHSFFKHSPQDS